MARGGVLATRVDLAPELPPVMGHSGQLQEVIVNLIQNAIEAMEMVDHDRREVKVRTECNRGNSVSIEIKDTGPGIDPKNSADIFEAFYTTKPHGMGLGLAICRMIVERHEGHLSASSPDQGGAIFRVTLPRTNLSH